MRKILFFSIFFLITGCNVKPNYYNFNSGTIIEKNYYPRREEVNSVFDQDKMKMTDKKIIRPEKYELIIEKCYDSIDQCFNKIVRVDKEVYDGHEIGDFYKSPADEVIIVF